MLKVDPIPAPSGELPERLSAQLLDLSDSLKSDDLSLDELMARFHGRVYTLLLVLLSLPFCQPIALPGLSIPFGVVIALLGLRFAFRQKPWLPQKLLATRIPSRFLPAVLRGSARFLRGLERFLHPRMTFLFEYRLTQFLAGLTIFICGLLLLLPLPIPFSNLLPAFAVVLVAASVAERDGVTLAMGAVVFLITLAFFFAIFLGGAEAIRWLEGHFGNYFNPGDESL